MCIYTHDTPCINHWFHVPRSMLGREAMGQTVKRYSPCNHLQERNLWRSEASSPKPFPLTDGFVAQSLRLAIAAPVLIPTEQSYMIWVRNLMNFGFGIGDLRWLSQYCVFLDDTVCCRTAMAWSQGSPSLGRNAWADSRWRVGRHDRLGVQSTLLSASEVS